MYTSPTDLLYLLDDATHVVYPSGSRTVLITYQHTEIVTVAAVDEALEANLRAVRARRVGSLRIIRAGLLATCLRRVLLGTG